MGRRAEGWVLRPVGETWFVRFTHNRRRHQYATGERDRGKAAIVAAAKYAEVVSGRRVRREVSADLEAVVGGFLSEYEKDHEEGTTDTVTMYFKAHLVPFFGDAEHITKESAQDYARERLTKTTRATVRKELSALRIFTSWAGLDVEIPGLPKYGHPGKRHPHARKEMATIVRAKDMDKILAKMPDRAPRGGHWVRPFFRLLWETALRPSTLFRLQAGKHYRKGDRELFITRDIDKGHAERRIPLSLPSRKALDQCVPEVGSIFATFSLREPLLRACEASQVKVPSLAPYDLKSSRLTAWANTPGIPLPGVQYLAGHASLATTAKYVVAQKEAAELVILGRIVGKKRAPKS